MKYFYTLLIFIYTILFRVFALFNKKAKLGLQGRKQSLQIIDSLPTSTEKIWMHCASLGEYEQGLPIWNSIKAKHPEYSYIVSFFSPSGYEEVRKKSDDVVIYLPFDLPKTQKNFIDRLQPSVLFYVKYDYWFNMMQLLIDKQVSQFVISALVTEKTFYFRTWARWFLRKLQKIDFFFVQDSYSNELLQQHDIHRTVVSGDTRISRVQEIAAEQKNIPILEIFCHDHSVFIAGSTWEKGEHFILNYLKKGISSKQKIVLAPHEVDAKNCNRIYEQFASLVGENNVVLFDDTNVEPEQLQEAKVLIINSIGVLKYAYRYADVAYIGGGFKKKGLHNILEAAAYEKPILCGPKIDYFPEAKNLKEMGGLFTFESQDSFNALLDSLWNKPEEREKAQIAIQEYMKNQPDSVEIVMKVLANYPIFEP